MRAGLRGSLLHWRLGPVVWRKSRGLVKGKKLTSNSLIWTLGLPLARSVAVKRIKGPKPRFRVGDWVSFLFGPGRSVAQIVEDHGLIGRWLYEIRWTVGADAESVFARSEELLEPAVTPDKANGISK